MTPTHPTWTRSELLEAIRNHEALRAHLQGNIHYADARIRGLQEQIEVLRGKIKEVERARDEAPAKIASVDRALAHFKADLQALRDQAESGRITKSEVLAMVMREFKQGNARPITAWAQDESQWREIWKKMRKGEL